MRGTASAIGWLVHWGQGSMTWIQLVGYDMTNRRLWSAPAQSAVLLLPL